MYVIAVPAAMNVPKYARTAWRNVPTALRSISVTAATGVSTVPAARVISV